MRSRKSIKLDCAKIALTQKHEVEYIKKRAKILKAICEKSIENCGKCACARFDYLDPQLMLKMRCTSILRIANTVLKLLQ